jgi:hypothetical protein
LSLLGPGNDQNHATDLVSTPVASPGAAAPDEPSVTIPVSLHAPSATALSLGELSAPEMEALFDLLQRDPNRASSISF